MRHSKSLGNPVLFLKRPCNTRIILNFNYFKEICLFQDGRIIGGSNVNVGVTITEQECASLVKRMKPDALGATLYGRLCFASYERDVFGTSDRHCFFGNILY